MTTLIIARHGNTFNANDTPTRVGARTDLPLVASGKEQARKIGAWLKEKEFYPEITYSSQLQRTKQTAEIALKELGYKQPVFALDIFNEIDYGVDENQTEDKVIARIGEQAIKDWDDKAKVPEGWKFNPDECIKNWQNFATQHTQPSTLTSQQKLGSNPSPNEIPDKIWDVAHSNIGDIEEIILVVTSNGTARFAPHLAGNFEDFADNNKIKLSTGALGILQFDNNQWTVQDWNIRP